MSSFDDEEVSILGSTQNGDSEENALSFNDSDFYLNMEDVDIGPQIGQGAFSKVYLGRYLGELVAVKKQARREADLEAYLMRELAVLKHFQHENLLQYVGASNAESVEPGGLGHVFIVTELACGGDLLALLMSEGEVGWKLRVSILTDAARALEFLHRKGLIHRDIKSPNILLDSQHRCKIADFGMARQIGTDMTVVGTDAYMAPELMFDSPYGTSADMFSFGIVLWETIYRQKAGSDDFIERRMADRFELDVQTLQEDAPPDTNPSLVELAAQLVQYEPHERPTAEDTLLWLEDLCDALPDDLEPPRTPIDYESLFPLETGERNPQRRGSAAKNLAKSKSTAVVKFSPTPVGLTPAEMTVGPGGDDNSFSSVNPMSPVILPSGRRATVGPAGAGIANKFEERSRGEPLGMKKAKSMQDCLTNPPWNSSWANGEERRAPDRLGLDEPELNIKNNTAVKNYYNYNYSYSNSGPPGDVHRDHHPPLCSDVQPELCTRYLFVCMQGGLTAGRTRSRSDSNGNGGGGGFGVARTEAGWKQGRSPLRSPGVGVGAGRGRGTSTFRAIGASHAPITRQGYLYKKGKSGLKNWQKRWFVLEGSKLIWYKDSKSYPREPRGYLELKGCFLVKGSAQRWKILSADATAEQDDYNREIGAKTVQDMEGWLKSLQEAIDGADTGEGPEGIMLPVLRGQENDLDRHLYNATTDSYRVDMSVKEWLDSLGLSSLTGAFLSAGYSDFLVIQEMGLTDEDLAYVGVKDAAQRKVLKLGAKGLVEPLLQVDISGFFNFHSEPVYRVDSKWRYLQASTYFEFSEFDDLHRRLKTAMKDTKFYKMMPTLPQRPNSKIGTHDHARQMARVQQNLNGYMQKLVMLVGAKEPYFTVLCEMLDLLPPDPHRLPVREDDFLAQIQSRIDRQRMGAAAGSGGGQAVSVAATAGGGGGGGRGMEGGGVVVNGGDPAKPASNQGMFSGVNGKGLPLSSVSASASSSPSVLVKRQPYSGIGSGGDDPTNSLRRPRSLGSSGMRLSKAKGKSRLTPGGAGGSGGSLGGEGGRVGAGSSSASTSA